MEEDEVQADSGQYNVLFLCEIIYSIKKIIGTTRGGGHMRGGKQRGPFP